MRYFCLNLMLIICLSVRAQMGVLYNADNQLPSSYVSCIYQDHDGYIWIATCDGLSRFDGYQFQIFNNHSESCFHITNNYINDIMQVHSGRFYIASNYGIQYYDGGQFHDVMMSDARGKCFSTFVSWIIQRHNGDILASTSGYGILKIINNRAIKLDHGIYHSIHYVNRIAEDHQQRLWILTEDQGLLCVNHNRITHYFSGSGRTASVRDICIDPHNNIYVVVRGQGLFKMCNNDNVFHHIAEVKANNLETIYMTRSGMIYLGTDGHGICVYNPFTHVVRDNPYFCWGMDLSKSKIQSVIEDCNGNLWIGMLQKGVFMQRAHRLPFNYMGYRLGKANVIGSNSVSAVLFDHHNRLWVGTDKDGLYLLDNQKHLLRHYDRNVPSTILNLKEDSKGRIWAGSFAQGLGYFDTSLSWHQQNYGIGLHTSVFGLVCDHNGNIWVGTMGEGLVCIHNDGSSYFYRMKKGAENHRGMNSLPNNYILGMSLSLDQKRLYICSSVGISCFNLVTHSFVDFFHTNCLNYGHSTRCAIEDRRGDLWIGTDHGLICYNIKKHCQRKYTIKDGLSNENIQSLHLDNKGKLWVGTSHGLNRINPATGSVICFFANNGLQSNEFGINAVAGNSSGELVFGGTGGITWFNPYLIVSHAWNARVRISSIIVGNHQLEDSLVANSHKFFLNYDDNAVALRFSTLTYEDSENITFLYSINNGDWQRLQPGRNDLNFAHLSSGTYYIRVKALKDHYVTATSEFELSVAAPWYASKMAYLIYLILLIIGIRSYLIYRKNKEKEHLCLQEHLHAEEMGEAKLKFFMNMSHEIRTPMTLIVSPLLQLLKEDHDSHRYGIYCTMRRNAERVLNLINQMMDLRKIEKGQMKMCMRKTNIVDFIKDVYTLFQQQAVHKNIHLGLEYDTDPIEVWIDRSNFDKVLVNLLSNAFKYTHVGGNIVIHITHDSHELKIAVSDDGEHIPEDKLCSIFDRFYQLPTKSNDLNVGTGIGLDLSRSIIELHYGSIVAHNLSKGCEFVITLPLGNSHLKADEMSYNGEENDLHHFGKDEFKEEPIIKAVSDETFEDRPHIAVVEDDEEIAGYLKEQLQIDYKVRIYPNGKEAFSAILQDVPSLVISDIMMPEMDGNILCSKLKTCITTNHVPVILLTAKSSDEDELQGLESGADAYIVKPFNMDILRCTISNLLHQRLVLRNKYNGNESQSDKVNIIKLESPDKKLMDRIMSVINENLSNSDLNVDMIADKVGLSRVHFYRKMKELTNQTPHSFIRNLRIRQAALLLTNSHQNISEVMYACGFTNLASFSTTFKSTFGLSPRDYQKKNSK